MAVGGSVVPGAPSMMGGDPYIESGTAVGVPTGPVRGGAKATAPGTTGQGARFIYAAATVANILCDNLTEAQVNLLASFLSVVTACVYGVLTVENPGEIPEG